jgi:S1-C subfamily serine protease
MKRISLLIVSVLLTAISIFAAPPRKAIMGALIKPVPGGLRVDSVVAGSTMEALHLQKGDMLTEINGIK